jgi:signal transduction histidine kinase
MKVAGLSYMSEWDWIIGPSDYYDDFNSTSLNMVRNSLLITGTILILIGAIFVFVFVNKK